jgi:hypothetical protein
VAPVKVYAINKLPSALSSACALKSGLPVSLVGAPVAHVMHVGHTGVAADQGLQTVQRKLQPRWAQVQGISVSLVAEGPDTDAAKDNRTAPKHSFGARGVPPRGRPV